MKYAYLIIANKNPNQLQKLITMIDDSRNDIYLMLDKKSGIHHNFHTNYSELNYVHPINIYWGGCSQIDSELILFKSAAPEHYCYYHLISGADLPLVNQDKIHDFFDNHLNKEFLAYCSVFTRKHLSQRIKHHLFRKQFRSGNKFIREYHEIERYFLHLLREPIPLNKIDLASNWVSIDDDLVQLLISRANVIHNIYKYGQGEDELFIPILINYYPRFIKKIYFRNPMDNRPYEFQGNMRYINWWKGSPYIWKMKDYHELIQAKNKGYLFSRKFDATIDSNIINKIFNNVMNS